MKTLQKKMFMIYIHTHFFLMFLQLLHVVLQFEVKQGRYERQKKFTLGQINILAIKIHSF